MVVFGSDNNLYLISSNMVLSKDSYKVSQRNNSKVVNNTPKKDQLIL